MQFSRNFKLKNMSQRVKNINDEMIVNLKFKVTLESISNHNGFTPDQVDRAREEFKDEIAAFLVDKFANQYGMEEFLQSVDFVNFSVDPN